MGTAGVNVETQRDPHLTNDRIDLYVAGRLDEEEDAAIEAHYLDCPDCRVRVEAVEALVDGLRGAPRRAPPWVSGLAAAAGIAALALGIQVVRLESRLANPSVPRVSSVQRLPTGDPPRFDLRVPTRDETLATISVPSEAEFIVLDLSVGEAAGPDVDLSVAIRNARGARVLELRGTRSDSANRLSIPVPSRLLEPGLFSVRLSGGGDVLEIPFEIVR